MMADYIGRISSSTDGTFTTGLNTFPVPKGARQCRVMAFGGDTVRFGSGEFIPTASSGAQLVAGIPCNVDVRPTGNDTIHFFASEPSNYNIIFHSA